MFENIADIGNDLKESAVKFSNKNQIVSLGYSFSILLIYLYLIIYFKLLNLSYSNFAIYEYSFFSH